MSSASHSPVTDRTFSLTLSLYVEPADLPQGVQHALAEGMSAPVTAAGSLRSLQQRIESSRALDAAIAPLFNDISNQKWLGQADEYVLDAKTGGAMVEITPPARYGWVIEGVRVTAAPETPPQPRPLISRRFWYVHKNGALSWHLSLSGRYDHRLADYFLLLVLQKALVPTEFAAQPANAPAPTMRPTAYPTTIFPLDAVGLQEAGEGPETLWVAVNRWFDADARALFDQLAPGWRAANAGIEADPFAHLIGHDPFHEIPGLEMPRTRHMLILQDAKLFDLALAAKRDEQACRDLLTPALSAAHFDLFSARQADAIEAGASFNAVENAPRGRDALALLFLSALVQNLIHFTNQDSAEVLDALSSIDVADSQTATHHLRYANTNALITLYGQSRTFEFGRDWIGACPYSFLLHCQALHNEFLMNAFETSSDAVIREVRRLITQERLGATELLNLFRIGDHADYVEARRRNTFRFDSEADAFGAIERIRGLQRRESYLEETIDSLEHQTGVFEERIQRGNERTVNYAVGAVGAFGLFQLVLQTVEIMQPMADPWRLPAVYATMIGSAVILAWFGWVVVSDVMRSVVTRGRLRRWLNGRRALKVRPKPQRRILKPRAPR